MNDRNTTSWSRLAAAARRAPASCDQEGADFAMPMGFSTRVVSLAGVRPSAGLFAGSAFERLAARALAFSCAGALAVTVWASLPSSVEASSIIDAAAVADYYLDPVGAVMEVVQS